MKTPESNSNPMLNFNTNTINNNATNSNNNTSQDCINICSSF